MPAWSKQNSEISHCLTRLGEWFYWGGEQSLAVASWGRVNPQFWWFSSRWRVVTRCGELWESSTLKNGIFDPKSSNPSISKCIMSLRTIKDLYNLHLASINKLSKHDMEKGTNTLCINPRKIYFLASMITQTQGWNLTKNSPRNNLKIAHNFKPLTAKP
jgi:hypothetical protein